MAIPIPSSTKPAVDGASITPSDTVNLTYTTRGIYVGVAGDVVAVMQSGAVLTFKNLAAGVIHPIAASRINSTGTAATDIVGVW
jgi:hypothetical protein